MSEGGGSPVLAGRGPRLAVVLAVTAAVVVADQVTTTLALEKLAAGPVHVLGPLRLELAFNSGVAFSLGSGLTVPIVLVVLVLVVLLVQRARGAPSVGVAVAIGLVLGGALGNLADRLFRAEGGAVVDFVRVGFWPTFNVADASIVVGGVLLAISYWRHPHPHRVDVSRRRAGAR
ncbi:MAG: signal peptidase II [Acidimicrobiales bacterium]